MYKSAYMVQILNKSYNKKDTILHHNCTLKCNQAEEIDFFFITKQ